MQDGKKMVQEKQETFRMPVTKVTIQKLDRFNQFFHFIKPDLPAVPSARSEEICPVIPLGSTWLKHDESKKVNKVEITFPDHICNSPESLC